MDAHQSLLTRGVVNIIPNRETLVKKMQSGEKLNVYLGIDPTATHTHLGHAVLLRKLQGFADAGHHVTFLIGDFTALIGDTADKDTERPVLTKKEIENNFQTYKQQAERVLNFSQVEIKYNSEWLHKLTFEEIIKLCQHFSVGDFNSRELIRKRLDEGKRVGLHEFLYPVMQGFDSYHMNTDIQIGGADQTFSMQAGRTLIKDLKNKESFVLATDFLPGTDGRKMSKSWGNAIWLDDSPSDMFAKVMAINDDLICRYFTLATDVPSKQVDKIQKELKEGKHPMPIKKDLAYQIVAELYDEQKAREAQTSFESRVQQKEVPSTLPILSLSYPSQTIAVNELLQTLNLVASNAEAKRLVEQGGVRIWNKTIKHPQDEVTIQEGMILQIGRKRMYKIKRD